MLRQCLYGVGALIFCTSACAWIKDYPKNYTPGFYIGVHGGWANADSGNGFKEAINYLYNVDSKTLATKDVDEGSWVGGRAYIGYNFTPYVSVETGGTYFPQNRYKGTGSGPIPYSINLRQRTYAIDLVGKLILPLGKLDHILAGWSVYGRAGGAYVSNELSGSAVINGLSQGNTNTREKIRPTYGLGIAYDITDNISADASWMAINSSDRVGFNDVISGKYHTPIPNCNLFSLGLSYKFINIF